MPRHLGRRLGSTRTRDKKSNTRHRKHEDSARGTDREEEPGIRQRCVSGTRKEPQREERATVMLLRRLPVLSALLVLLLAAGRCTAAALLRGSGTRTEGRVDGGGALEAVGRYPRSRTETLTGHGMRGGPERGGRSHHGLEAQSRDPRHKEKFIRHLTGPLYIDPKCRKQFHRLYHNTRDCTVPAFYKRCARLLTQLAKSPRCSDR